MSVLKKVLEIISVVITAILPFLKSDNSKKPLNP